MLGQDGQAGQSGQKDVGDIPSLPREGGMTALRRARGRNWVEPRLLAEEEESARPAAEVGPAPVEARGIEDIRTRPRGQAGGLREGEKRKQSQTSSLTFYEYKAVLSGKVKYIFHFKIKPK